MRPAREEADRKKRSEDEAHQQPCDEQVQALESVEANGVIVSESGGCEYYDGGDPAYGGDVTEEAGSTRRDAVDVIRRRAGCVWLTGAAAAAEDIAVADIISASGAEGHFSILSIVTYVAMRR